MKVHIYIDYCNTFSKTLQTNNRLRNNSAAAENQSEHALFYIKRNKIARRQIFLKKYCI